MLLLLVGDYHAEPSDLDDCRRLADLIVSTAVEHKATVLFMGDQYHTHAIIHAEVQLFWIQFYQRLRDANVSTISLIGNHDKPGSAHSKATAMLAHKHQTQVVHEPYVVHTRISLSPDHEPVMLFLPYYDDTEEFVKVCNEYSKVPTLFCHQTFNGAAYDNGFYDKHGVDPNLIPQKQVISGHIHAPQEFSKVWYVGAPRWRTLSDADTERAIWLVDVKEDGSVNKISSFNTGLVCRKICTFVDNQKNWTDDEGEEWAPPFLSPKHEWRVDIHGTAEYIDKRMPVYRIMHAKVRTFRTELEQPKVKESEGVAVAFEKWVDDYQPQHGTDKNVLRETLKERVKLG